MEFLRWTLSLEIRGNNDPPRHYADHHHFMIILLFSWILLKITANFCKQQNLLWEKSAKIWRCWRWGSGFFYWRALKMHLFFPNAGTIGPIKDALLLLTFFFTLYYSSWTSQWGLTAVMNHSDQPNEAWNWILEDLWSSDCPSVWYLDSSLKQQHPTDNMTQTTAHIKHDEDYKIPHTFIAI